jgi:type II secretory pathway component GspD/PulD (secretin)
MEQPFFHQRSVQSSVSVYPGATIVMGGLITEMRRAMDDKIPVLGDLPFIGRFFRNHSEKTSKRNLLIFVTTRLVDAHGREVPAGSATRKEKAEGEEAAANAVQPSPAAAKEQPKQP